VNLIISGQCSVWVQFGVVFSSYLGWGLQNEMIMLVLDVRSLNVLFVE